MYIFFIIILVIYFVLIIYFNIKYPEDNWNWKNISLNKIKFPNYFMWGTATAAHQVEGQCVNNWSKFEKREVDSSIFNIKSSDQLIY